MTWGEFVEARMLAEFRDRDKVPNTRLRAAVDSGSVQRAGNPADILAMYHRSRLTLNETAVFGRANRWHVRKVRDINPGLRSRFSIQQMISRWPWDSEGSLGYRRRQGR